MAALSACSTTETVADAERSVSFVSAEVPLSVAVTEAQVAVSGTPTRYFVDPIDDSDFVSGRKLVMFEVSTVYRGDLRPGDTIAVWYGSELRNGVEAEEGGDLVVVPKVDTEVLLLASQGVLDTIGPVFLPVEGSGMARITNGRVKAGSTEGLRATDVSLLSLEPILRTPAVDPDPGGSPADPSLPDPGTLPREPQPAPDRTNGADSDPEFYQMLTDLDLSMDEFMQLPGDEQQQLADQYGVGS